MCGRYVVVSKVEKIEKVFRLAKPAQMNLFAPNYNLSVGNPAPIITSEHPNELSIGQFGLTPSWAKKRMYLFNARSEGDSNKDDDPQYTGGKGIINKPSFRSSIRKQRCLVVADCFYEGSKKEGLSKPYLIYLKDRRPFAFAGLWDKWVDTETGEIVLSFSIITTVANELLQDIGHHRSPVILRPEDESVWLNESSSLGAVTALLEPYPSTLMNAYPVSAAVKSPKNNGRELVEPEGQRISPEYEYKIVQELKLEGMGANKTNEPVSEEERLKRAEEQKRKGLFPE
jgi:putative SOS response-associated peptidase YedK